MSKYDNLIWTFTLEGLFNIGESLVNKTFSVNLSYEKYEDRLLKMDGKGICSSADEMVYYYVDENEYNLDNLMVGDKIQLDGGILTVKEKG